MAKNKKKHGLVRMAKNKNALSVVILLAVTAAFALLGAGQAFAFCSVCTEDTIVVVQPTGTFELAAGTVVPIEVLIDLSTVGVSLDTTNPLSLVFFSIFNSSGSHVGGATGPGQPSGQLFNVTPVNMSQSQWRANWTITPELINAGNVTEGTYSANTTVIFRKSDSSLLTDLDSSTFTLTAPDTTAPTANAGPDSTVNEDTLVTFNGSGSTDNVGITSYTWTFTDGTAQTLTGATPTYTFATPGTYIVALSVADAAGNTATDTVTITVNDITPPSVMAVGASPGSITQGESTTISATVTDAVALNLVLATFTSPSGSTTQQTMMQDSGVFSTSFATSTATETGTWSATIIASDTSGNINGTESTTFTVTAAPPVINLPNQTNGTATINQTNTTLNCDESTITNLSIVGANGIQVNNCILAGSPQLLVQNSVGSMNNLVVSTPGMSITIENGTLTLTNVAFGDGSGAQVLFPTATLTGTVAVNDSLLSVTPTSASLDSAAVPGLNTSATLTFPNVPFGNPRVVFNDGNGSANQVCEAPRCQNFSFANGVVNFTVTQWSEYIVEETPNNDNGGNNDGGSGGGGGGTRYVPTVAPTAVASGPTCAELAQALSCGTGSVATCSFPSSTTDRPFCKALVSAGTEVERPAGQAAASTQTAPAQNDQASFGNAIISDNALTGAAAARVPGGSKTLLGAGAVVAVLGILLGIATALRRR